MTSAALSLALAALSAAARGAPDPGAVSIAPSRASRRRFFEMESPQEVQAALEADLRGRSLPTSARLAKVSERFLGTPYRLGPLGDGPKGEFDRGPLLELRAVDCRTFLEETMAFALEGDFTKGVKTLARIRYKGGAVGYETRNHFPAADWIPNNINAGFLRDITRRIAGDATRRASKVIRKADWYSKKGAADLRGFEGLSAAERAEKARQWRARGALFPDRPVSVDYLPLELLPKYLPKIPPGTIANLVREDRPDKPTLISHQVFIFDGPEGKIVRHAAAGRAVEDVPALQYFRRYDGSDWKLLGLNLDEVLNPSDRAASRKARGGAK